MTLRDERFCEANTKRKPAPQQAGPDIDFRICRDTNLMGFSWPEISWGQIVAFSWA